MHPSSSKPTRQKERDSLRTVERVQWAGAQATPPVLWQALRDEGTMFIGETADLSSLAEIPYGATAISPALLVEGLRNETGRYLLWVAMEKVMNEIEDSKRRADDLLLHVVEQYLVEAGAAIIESAEACSHFTFIGLHNCTDKEMMVAQARRLLFLYEENGVGRERVVVSILGTKDGLMAARELEAEHGIRTNVLFIGSLTHASICSKINASFMTLSYATLRDTFASDTTCGLTSADERVLSTLQSITTYLQRSQTKTRLLVSDLPEPEDAREVRGTAGVFVRDPDARLLRKLRAPLAPPAGTDSPERLCAALARLPLNGEEDHAALTRAFSDGVVSKTLMRGVGRLQAHMRTLCSAVSLALRRRVYVRTLDVADLARLYEDDWRTEIEIRGVKGSEDEVRSLDTGTERLVSDLEHRKEHVGYRLYCSTWGRKWYNASETDVNEMDTPAPNTSG